MPMPNSLKLPELPEEGPFRDFLEAFCRYGGSDGLTNEVIGEVRRAYYANVSIIDRAVGEIVRALERTNQLDNTWIIYTSDHGEMLGEHRMLMKMVFYEPSVRVPLIIRPPGGRAGGPEKIEELVELLDLGATVRDIAGIGAKPPATAGHSLVPAIEGSEPFRREVVISQNYGFAMFRERRYKLVIFEDGLSPGQLFDLETDPLEEHNRIGDPEMIPVIERMMNQHVRPFFATRPRRLHAGQFCCS